MLAARVLSRWRDWWLGSLRTRLVALSLTPLLVAFPLIIAILVALGGTSFARLLATNALDKANGAHNYLDQVSERGVAHLRQMSSAELPQLLAAHLAGKGRSEALDQLLSLKADSEGYDFLIVADEAGKIIASSTGSEAGARLPDSFVFRQASAGIPASAYEILNAAELRTISPQLASRARIDLSPAADSAGGAEERGLLIQFATHLPLSGRYPNLVVVGGILLNRNSALIDRIRDVVYPLDDRVRLDAGTTSIFLDDVRVATNLRSADGQRALGSRASPEVSAEVLVRGGAFANPGIEFDVPQISGCRAIGDGDARRIGMLCTGFPRAPYVRDRLILLGSVAALLAMTLLALTLVNLRSTGAITRRIGQISDAMSAVRNGDRSLRIGPLGAKDEIAGLAAHFNGLVDTLAAKEQQQRQAEAAIVAEASRRRALFEHLREGLVVLNDDGSVFEVNRKFAEMLGYGNEEALRLHVSDWSADTTPGEVPAEIRAVGTQGTLFQTLYRRKDGSTYAVEVSATRIEWDGRQYLLCIVYDITERLRLAGELEQHRDKLQALVEARTLELAVALDEAQSANRAKSHFLATMSHEIRTPMNGILGMAQLLLEPGLKESERLDYARVIIGSGRTLLSLLNDILDLSKVEAGKVTLESTEFNGGVLLQEVEALFAAGAQAKGISLRARWKGAGGCRYKGDAHRLKQMLSNLVGNAIKFTVRGQVRVEAREIERSGGFAVLEFAVADSGIGIAADKLPLLFNTFSQADSSTTRQFGGTGLGLSIVRSLARLMGGDVGVASEEGKGSRFWFRVRVERVDSATDCRECELPCRTEKSAPALRFSGRVLAVDDNRVNRMLLRAMLVKMGLEVSEAEDGQQAVDAVTRGAEVDLVFMDIQMPVLDGLAATRRIRAWEQENGRQPLPIVALTADAFAERRRQALDCGMDDLLTKPYEIDAIRALIARWLPEQAS
ncbi:ATP-binding protein [Rhodocyclus purpureus]|uniref:ATP-binding protein n=1 Tax=Rhodocyclus purpureus TaxID=1067 RepID=UPI001913DE87|nr:ATP-binding protein [Rhodocyclus purpureus]